jgi:serine/threonine protein kinase
MYVRASNVFKCSIASSWYSNWQHRVWSIWQVLASKTKIYLVLEYVSGGELFSKIVSLRTTCNLYLDHTFFEIITAGRFYRSLQWDLKFCWSEFLCLWSFQLNQGRLREDQSRKYFQQLIDAVDYCHSRRVYHRDLKVGIRGSQLFFCSGAGVYATA